MKRNIWNLFERNLGRHVRDFVKKYLIKPILILTRPLLMTMQTH